MELWRISNHLSLNGEGARRAPARWHSGGEPVVYLAASPPGALIEVLVHLEIGGTTDPPTFTLLRVSAPDKLREPLLQVPEDEAWKAQIAVTQKLGDAWLASRISVLARVPSAILPHTFNYLLNPLHPDAAKISITDSQRAVYDSRLLPRTR